MSEFHKFRLNARLVQAVHLFVAVVAYSTLAFAQSGAANQLHARLKADAAVVDVVFAARLEKVVAIRELTDGRVIVSDRQQQALFVLDAQSRTPRQIGRSGDGPGEYRNPGRIFPLGHDSALVVDDNNRKWYLLDGDRFVSLSDAMRQNYLRVGGEISGIARDASVLNVRALGPIRTPPGPLRALVRGRPEHADSLVLILHTLAGRVDTVMRGESQFLGVSEKHAVVNGTAENFLGVLNPLQSNDQAVMLPDGTIVVVHFSPYSVDWRKPDGLWTRGTRIIDPTIPVTSEIRRDIAADYLRDNEGKAVFLERDFPPWPKIVPPFTLRALTLGSDGNIYVRRTELGRDGDRIIDVLSQSGLRIASVQLPRRARFVGAGARGLYAVERNADDEEVLTRYRYIRSSPK